MSKRWDWFRYEAFNPLTGWYKLVPRTTDLLDIGPTPDGEAPWLSLSRQEVRELVAELQKWLETKEE